MQVFVSVPARHSTQLVTLGNAPTLVELEAQIRQLFALDAAFELSHLGTPIRSTERLHPQCTIQVRLTRQSLRGGKGDNAEGDEEDEEDEEEQEAVSENADEEEGAIPGAFATIISDASGVEAFAITNNKCNFDEMKSLYEQ